MTPSSSSQGLSSLLCKKQEGWADLVQFWTGGQLEVTGSHSGGLGA